MLLPASAAPDAAAPAPLRVEGEPVARSANVSGSELVLNGTGVRAVAWFKGYVAALYLPSKASAPERVVAMPGAKRLQLRMLQNVPAEEFVKALRKGVTRNTDSTEMPAISADMERFAGLIEALGSVRKGDVVDLDLHPGQGMVFTVNGTRRGDAIGGDAFYGALLRSFVGEHPYDKAMRLGLLGTPG